MAIYTQYGRYLKAKQFKEMLEDKYEAYMLFGLGNPKWTDSTENQPMPFGPHNTNILLYGTDTANQFYDANVQQYFSKENNTAEQFVSYSKPITEYARKVAELLPVFPAIWYKYTMPTDPETPIPTDMFTISNDINSNDINIDLMKYQNYYIQSGGDGFHLKDITAPEFDNKVNMPSTPIAKMYFAELYLRGLAIENSIKAPVGLLGAIKCNLSLVRDLGVDESKYTGLQSQFWYGDRYWEIVNPNDTSLEDYIKYKDESGNLSTTGVAEYYPTHLLFTSMINPRNLCDDLNIDNCIAPQQLAIYIRKKHYNADINAYENGKPYYRVDGNNIFNFGQYTAESIKEYNIAYDKAARAYQLSHTDKSKPLNEKYIFNFTLPDENHKYNYDDPKLNDGEFKLLLHDYIKGQIRENHSIEKIGYIVGF